MSARALRVALAVVLSGSAALVYEVVWLRMLGLVVGQAVDALTAVLVAFMGGLALGAALFGRLAGRLRSPLAVCAWLEAAIAMYAVLLPLALAGLPRVSLAVGAVFGLSYGGFAVVQTALGCALLLPPTVLMGGTLPLLSHALAAGQSAPARVAGTLYALNTFGAVLGAVSAGYWLLPAAGNRETGWVAAGANLAAAALLLAAASEASTARAAADGGRARASAVEARHGGETARIAGGAWLIAAAMAVSGAAAMVLEVAWTRALALVIGSSTYAFTAVLVAVLVGIAAGSALYVWWRGGRPAGLAALGAIEAGVGGFTALLLLGFERLPDLLLVGLRWSDEPAWVTLLQILVSAGALLPATLCIGASLPCALAATPLSGARVGRRVGRLYAANTAGGVAGAILGGLVLIPGWGVHAAVETAIVASLALAAVLFAVSGRGAWRYAPVAASLLAAGAALFAPPWDTRVMSSAPAVYAPAYLRAAQGRRLRDIVADETVLFYKDGRSGSVAVTRQGPHTLLRINGKIDAGTVVDMPTQLMAAHLPLLAHASPRAVFILGLGSGVTAAAAARHPVERVDVLEIEPAVVEASRFFAAEQDGALADPRVRIVIGDGRSFLLSSGASYDVIISEPSNPWVQGMAGLFSAEFFALARQRLRSGGVMLQWVQSYNLAPDDLKMVVATFRTAFPATSVWEPAPGDFLLLGRAAAAPLDLAGIRARWDASPRLRAGFERLGLRSWASMLGFFALGEADAARLGAEGGINTDDRLPLEFRTPRALYRDTTTANRALVAWFRRATLPDLTAESTRELDHADSRYWAGIAGLRRGAPADALAQFEKALALDPSHLPSMVGASTAALQLGRPADALAFARRGLAREPAQPTALFLAGAASWWLGQTDNAERFFARASALEPQNGEFRGALERLRSGTLSK